MQNIRWTSLDIRIYAVLASLLISIGDRIHPALLNNDAYTYIRTADIYLNEGASAAVAHYTWAAYPILIGTVSRVLSLDLINAGFLLNAVFFALLTYAYLSIVREIRDSRLLLVLAAITILVFPSVNEFRTDLIRDNAFLALTMTAFWQFVRFWQTRRFREVVKFTLLLLLASAFRIEGILYLLCTPLILLCDSERSVGQRLRAFGQLERLGIVFLLASAVALLVTGHNVFQMGVDFVSTYIPFIQDTLFPPREKAIAIATALFNDFAADFTKEYVLPILIFSLLTVIAGNFFQGFGGVFLSVLIYGLVKRLTAVPRHVWLPMMAFMLVNGVILFVFVFFTRYLTSRYTLVLCCVLSLLIPVILQRALEQAEAIGKQRMATVIVGLLLVYCALAAYVRFGADNSYYRAATDWILSNSAADTPLLTNAMSVAYDSGRVPAYDEVQRNIPEAAIDSAAPGTLLAVDMTYIMAEILERELRASRVELLQEYFNEEDLKFAIYRRSGRP